MIVVLLKNIGMNFVIIKIGFLKIISRVIVINWLIKLKVNFERIVFEELKLYEVVMLIVGNDFGRSLFEMFWKVFVNFVMNMCIFCIKMKR